MRAENVTRRTDPELKAFGVRVAEATLSAFNFAPNPPLSLIWVRPLAQGTQAQGPVYDFDPRGCRALLHRAHPNVIFVNTAESKIPVEEIAHECGHIFQNAGLAPSAPDIEAFPTQLGEDVAAVFDSQDPAPLTEIFFAHHERGDLYRSIRRGSPQFPAAMIWNVVAEPPQRPAPTPKPTNHAAAVLAANAKLPANATAFGLLRGFRAW